MGARKEKNADARGRNGAREESVTNRPSKRNRETLRAFVVDLDDERIEELARRCGLPSNAGNSNGVNQSSSRMATETAGRASNSLRTRENRGRRSESR